MPTKGCIVIVEPDDLIRELLERWLDEAGFQSIYVARDHALPMVMPRLVITDISDPDRAGDTIAALRAAYAAPILATSARFRRGLAGSIEPAQRLHVRKVLRRPWNAIARAPMVRCRSSSTMGVKSNRARSWWPAEHVIGGRRYPGYASSKAGACRTERRRSRRSCARTRRSCWYVVAIRPGKLRYSSRAMRPGFTCSCAGQDWRPACPDT